MKLKPKPGITVWLELMNQLHVHFHLDTATKPTLSVQVLEEMIAGVILLILRELDGDIVRNHVVSVCNVTGIERL